MLGFGVMTGLAMSGVTFVVVLGAVGRIVPPGKRTLAFGIVTAGGSLGQFLVVPAAQGLLDALDWRLTLLVMAALVALIIPLALGVAGRPPVSDARDGLPLKQALAEAGRHPSFWLINLGFFVCGFHIAFVGTHLPAYIRDEGLSASVGAGALALIGLFNIAGSLTAGALSSCYRMKSLLSLMYASRALMILIYLAAPKTALTFYIFAAALGFTWLATVPPTAGLVGKLFGTRYLATLFGLTLLSHQIGGFFGAWLGGLSFVTYGDYQWMWYADITLALAAAAVHLPIREQKVAKSAPALAK